MTSLSRQLARWVAALRYEDLPPAVVDRAKGVTLHSLASVLLGSRTPGGRQAVKLITEEEVNSTIDLCASLESGNLEGARSGGRALREGAAVRNAMLAVALAKEGHPGGETVLEGDAGFYHAYAGNNRGQLAYSFVGDTRTSLDKITAGLGTDWMFLETLYRIYYTAGYNIAHVDVTAKLCEEHDIRVADIDRIEAV